MKKGNVDAKGIGKGSWGRRMVRDEVLCQEKPQEETEKEVAASRRRCFDNP